MFSCNAYTFTSIPKHAANLPYVGLECETIELLDDYCCGASYTDPLDIYVYCDECNVTVGVQWFDHIAVDLELQLTRQNMTTVYVS